MNFRNDWTPTISIDDEFLTKTETINEVLENFNLRRKRSAEGKCLVINGVADDCLVQTSSNPLRELEDFRKIHCPLNMDVKRGYYVKYEGDIWLIDTNVVNVDDAYWSTRMSRCQYVLKWQDYSGKIIERPVYLQNASAYNNGESGNKYLTIGTDQLMLFLPFDEDTKAVKRGTKFFIDHNMNDPMVYKLTRPDRTTYVHNGIGNINWLVTEDQHTTTARELEVGVPDYIEPPTLPPVPDGNQSEVLCRIEYSGKPRIIIGSNYKKFTAVFYDTEGNIVSDQLANWKVTADDTTEQYVHTKTNNDNSIQIKIDYNDALAGKYLKLDAVDVNNICSSSIFVEIGGAI